MFTFLGRAAPLLSTANKTHFPIAQEKAQEYRIKAKFTNYHFMTGFGLLHYATASTCSYLGFDRMLPYVFGEVLEQI